MFKSNLFILISVGFLFFSCEENKNDPQFCECLAISKSLNEQNQKLVKYPAKRKEIFQELKKIVSEKRSVCEPYKNRMGDELIELEKYCQN